MTEPSQAGSDDATDPDATVTTPAPSGPERPRRPLHRRLGVVLTTAITVIGAAASVVGIIQVVTRDRTNFSHLQMSAAPSSPAATEWAVPEDALADLPTGLACEDELVAWLGANAEELHRSLTITLRNTATEGAMLALTDLRSTAPAAERRGRPSVRLVCDPAGVPPQQIYYGRVDADQPSAVAQHVRIEAGAPPNTAPSIPVTFNLAPGEAGALPVELFSRVPAAGALEVTVLSGTEERVVAIEGSEFDVPAMLHGGDMYLYSTPAGVVCLQTQARTIAECTLEELTRELGAAAG